MATQVYSAPNSAPFGAGMRVVLWEPDSEVRALLRALIDRDPMLSVVAEACDWRECEEYLEDLLPELLIVQSGALPEEWRRTHQESALPVVMELMGPRARGIRLLTPERESSPPNAEAIKQSLAEAVKKVYERKVKQLWWLMDRYVTGLQPNPEHPPALKVEREGLAVDLEVRTILSIVAARKHVTVHGTSGCFTMREPIHRVASQLDPSVFVRIHRSVIINSRQLDLRRSMSANPSQAILRDGSIYPVGPNYRQAFAAMLESAS